MKDDLTSKAADNTPSEAKQALRVLEEMDDLIAQLSTDRSQDVAYSQPVQQDRPDPNQSSAFQAPVENRVEAKATFEQDSEALESQRQCLDEKAASLEIQRVELHDQQLRLSQESRDIKQAWESIAQEKNELIQQRAVLEDDQRSLKASCEESEQKKEHSVQVDRLKRHRQTIEKAWVKLRKEKAVLAQERRRLKLEAKSLSECQDAEPRADRAVKKRLDGYRRQLKEQYQELCAGEAVVDLARHQYTQLLEQRQMLVEVKRFLCSYEAEVVRRWSVNRSVGLVGGVVSCLLFLLIFSYEVGHRVVDPVWRAGTVVGITSEVLNESRYGSDWLTQQHQLLVSDQLVSEAIRLGAQRGVRLFDDVGQMREALSRGLSVQLRSPGRILIEFRNSNEKLSVNVVKSLGRAFVSHHTMEDRVSGRPNSMRIYEAAATDPFPVKDGRMLASVATLVIAVVMVTVLALLLWWWLSHSAYVFEQQAIPELDQLEDDDLWPAEASSVDHDEQDSHHEQPEDFMDPLADEDHSEV